VLKDECDESLDRDLANFVVNSHYKSQQSTENQPDILPQRYDPCDDVELIDVDLLRKYLN